MMTQEKIKSEERSKNLQLQRTIGPSKFVVNFAQESEKTREKVFKFLEKANQKRWGREITFKDLTSYALSLLTDKDVKMLQESSFRRHGQSAEMPSQITTRRREKALTSESF